MLTLYKKKDVTQNNIPLTVDFFFFESTEKDLFAYLKNNLFSSIFQFVSI